MAGDGMTPGMDRIRQLQQAQANASALAKQELGRIFTEIQGLEPARQRDALLELVPALIDKYADVSNAAAAEWYDQVRAQWFSDGFTARPAPQAHDDVTRLIRTKADVLFGDDADPGEMLRFLNGVVDKGVKQGGRDAIRYNVRRDPRKPRYARVPQGPTCEFCIMLASRGFVYDSADTAGAMGQYHADCNCATIPSWGAHPHVDGYDPDRLYETYSRCAVTVDDDNITSRYPIERKIVRDSETGIEHWETRNEFRTRCILSEMHTRRKEWLNNPFDVVDYTSDEKAVPKAKEIQAAQILCGNGFTVHFRQTRALERKRTSDIFLGNGVSSLPWELKQPIGNGRQTIAHQFEEAAGQSSRLVLDITELDSHGRWTYVEVLREVRKLIGWHWKDPNGDVIQYAEVLILRNNKLTRIIRPSNKK
ncbi:MAG: hypothetical protein PUF51_00985 [Bifidobacteriaceae bacterium]|nr:hypothetical protein [Bifidobacteriaceae bacterium]